MKYDRKNHLLSVCVYQFVKRPQTQQIIGKKNAAKI